MPDLQTLVNRMVDAGESDEDIDLVVNEYKRLHPPKPPAAPAQKIANDEEDSFFGGFTKSLFGGEALGAGLKGALGYAKGAIADLPSTIIGGVQDAFEAASDPVRTIKEAPGAFRYGIPEVAKSMAETTARAGSDPEAFGRMVGQFTGQPLTTAGVMKGAPMLRKPIGAVVEGTGRIMKKHQPISGMAPRILDLRTARNVERGVGKGIESLGQTIRGNKKPPPPPYSLGAGAPAEQPVTRFPTKTLKPPKDKAAKKTASKPAEPPKKDFKPSNDPKTNVDTSTGEILDEAPTMEAIANELKAKGVDYKELVRKSRAKWNLSDLISGEEGSAAIPQWAESVAEWMATRKKKPVNPLRPEVPEGQVTNRKMFDLSAERGAENQLAAQSRQFGDEVSPAGHEFSEDMLFTPEELTQPDIPQFTSPFENQFDPRIAPGGVPSDPFEGVSPTFSGIQKRMYELTDKGTAGTLTAEELAEAQKLNKTWRNHPEFDTEPNRAGIELPEPTSAWERQKNLFKSETGSIGDDVKQKTIGQPSPLASRLVKDGDVVRTQVKDVGPRGQSFTVTSPDGKKLGEIAVTNERVEEILRAYGGDGDPDDIAKLIYETDLDDILEQHGFKDTDLPRMKVEPKSNREKGAKTQVLNKPAKDPEVAESKATEPKPEPVKEELPKIDPDSAFAKGGDIKAIVAEAARLDQTKAVDNKYKSLLPKELRFELGEGETYKGRLKDLTQIIQESDSASPEQSALKVAARDKFLDSVRDAMGKEPTSNVPLLNFKDLKASDFKTPVEGKLKRLLQDKARSKPEVWTSPKPKNSTRRD